MSIERNVRISVSRTPLRMRSSKKLSGIAPQLMSPCEKA
jgi:hypothetical protein